MSQTLPPIPRVIFTVVEPISLVAGFLGAIIGGPDWFVAEQIAPATLVPATDNTRLVAFQLANLYLLMAFVGVGVLMQTTDPKVVRNYLIALWLGDVGHIGFTYHVLGHQRFMDVGHWNAMTWGNVAATALLCLARTAYLLGLFGPDRPVVPTSKKAR